MIRTNKCVRDRGGHRNGHLVSTGHREGVSIGLQIGGRSSGLVDGEIPSIDEYVSLPTDLSNQNIELVDIVASKLILPFVVDWREGRQHQVGLSRLAGGVGDAVQITAEIGDGSGGSQGTVGFRLVSKIESADGDMHYMGPKSS